MDVVRSRIGWALAGGGVLVVALACGGTAPDTTPWSAVVVPEGGTVASSDAARRVVEHEGDLLDVIASWERAAKGAGCDLRAYPGGFRPGLIGHFACDAGHFEAVVDAGPPVKVTLEAVPEPAPVALAASAPWASARVRPASEALAVPVSCSLQFLLYEPEGVVSGGDPENHETEWRGSWVVEGGALVVTGRLERKDGEAADPSDDPGPPAPCGEARLHDADGTLTWLCRDGVVGCSEKPDRSVWVSVRGDEAARALAGRALVGLWGPAQQPLIAADDGPGVDGAGVEVSWRPQPGSPAADTHEQAALEALSVLERDLSVSSVTIARDPDAAAPVVVRVGPDVKAR